MNGGHARTKGVFLYDDPTIEKLKACAFFWKNVVVFESYLSEVVEHLDLVGPTLKLFRNDILKISHTPDGLRSALTDKIYYSLDRELWEYIYNNAEKVTVAPKLPEDAERIIRESTERDRKDSSFLSLIDEAVHRGIENKWLDSIREYDRIPFNAMPDDLRRSVISQIRKITEMEYKHYRDRGPMRHGLEWRNRALLEQTSVGSALFVRSAWLPYYQYKLGNYAVKDARRYLEGLNVVMPFVKRNSIDNFSLNEVLEIRRNKRWDNAMDKLAELCGEITYGTDLGQFRKEMQEKVISEYQDALGEEEATWMDLGKHLLKGSIFAGVSLVPIVGNVVSAATGLVDPLMSHLWKENAQRNLPFFLNDLRKARTPE